MSIWQTHDWQHMLQRSGQSEAYFEINTPPSLPLSRGGIIFVEKRQVSLGEKGLFVIGFEGEMSLQIEQKLIELCRKEKCLFVQVETIKYYNSPCLRSSDIPLDEGELNYSPSSRGKPAEQEGEFFSGYYKKFIPPHTCVIDLTQSTEDILASMKPKGRYNIRLAEKKGVVVEQVEKNPHNIETFYKLMLDTTSRDDFSGNTQQYYEIFLKSIKESQLFFAYYEDQVIAAGIFVFEDDIALYYYGASGNKHRNLMAPYLLQWRVIEHAKKRSCKVYDFLGVTSPDETNSPLAGVTQFKKKLSPDIREVSQGYIYVHKKWKYRLISVLRKFKK